MFHHSAGSVRFGSVSSEPVPVLPVRFGYTGSVPPVSVRGSYLGEFEGAEPPHNSQGRLGGGRSPPS